MTKATEDALQKKLDAANAEIAKLKDAGRAIADAPDNSWQEADYTGPLNMVQAAWRNAHIKPVAEKTKPAAEVVTK